MEKCRFYSLYWSFLVILAIIPEISASGEWSLVDFFIDNWTWFAIGFLGVQAILGYVLYRVIRNKRQREEQMAMIEEMSKSKRKSKKQSKSRSRKSKRKKQT